MVYIGGLSPPDLGSSTFLVLQFVHQLCHCHVFTSVHVVRWRTIQHTSRLFWLRHFVVCILPLANHSPRILAHTRPPHCLSDSMPSSSQSLLHRYLLHISALSSRSSRQSCGLDPPPHLSFCALCIFLSASFVSLSMPFCTVAFGLSFCSVLRSPPSYLILTTLLQHRTRLYTPPSLSSVPYIHNSEVPLSFQRVAFTSPDTRVSGLDYFYRVVASLFSLIFLPFPRHTHDFICFCLQFMHWITSSLTSYCLSIFRHAFFSTMVFICILPYQPYSLCKFPPPIKAKLFVTLPSPSSYPYFSEPPHSSLSLSSRLAMLIFASSCSHCIFGGTHISLVPGHPSLASLLSLAFPAHYVGHYMLFYSASFGVAPHSSTLDPAQWNGGCLHAIAASFVSFSALYSVFAVGPTALQSLSSISLPVLSIADDHISCLSLSYSPHLLLLP